MRVAVVPHPPLLVPELVAGAVGDTEPVRSTCLAVARDLAEVAGHWIAVGIDATAPCLLGPDVSGTFAGYGVDVPVSLSDVPSPADPELPLAALVAGWLRGRVGARSVRVELVHPDLPTADCVALGERLAGGPEVGLLVLGDGSHRHGEHAVGRTDDRAGPFDEGVRKALAAADVNALLALDVCLAAELGASGRAAWQVLAGVPGPWRCARSEFLVPFGVGYHVAAWHWAYADRS